MGTKQFTQQQYDHRHTTMGSEGNFARSPACSLSFSLSTKTAIDRSIYRSKPSLHPILLWITTHIQALPGMSTFPFCISVIEIKAKAPAFLCFWISNSFTFTFGSSGFFATYVSRFIREAQCLEKSHLRRKNNLSMSSSISLMKLVYDR